MNGPASVAAPDTRLFETLADLVGRWRPGRTLVEVRVRPVVRSSSWWLAEVRVELDDGDRLVLAWKDLEREGHRSGARRVKPSTVRDADRELAAYDVLTARGEGGVPRRLGAVADPSRGVRWLLLEWIEGVPLWQMEFGEPWLRASEWLGHFHAHGMADPPGEPPLLHHTPELHATWFDRAASGPRAVEVGALAAAHGQAMELVFQGPETFIHGDFNPANLLVRGSPGEPPITVLDWEMAGPGPALLDLASLLSGRWTDGQRNELARAYHRARDAAGAPCAPFRDFRRRLDAAGVLVAVQWLGWAPNWTPPDEQRNDWLAEASRAAERMDP